MALSSKVFFSTESYLADLALEESNDDTLASLSIFEVFKTVSKMEARKSKNQYVNMYGTILRWDLLVCS